MQPMIGVVGALYILQGATYVYESLFGKIQPFKENDSSLSVEDGCTSDKYANLTAKQRRKKRKIERRKELAAGRANAEGESEGQIPQENSAGLAEVMTASSSNDPVEEINQARPAQSTTKHQGASLTKDQGRKESAQNKQDSAKDPRSPSPNTVDDSVPSTSSKIHPKSKVQLLTSEAKKGCKRKEAEKHTCGSAKKNALTTSSKEQFKKQPVTHNQRPTCVVNASKKGLKDMEPKKHTCDNTEKNVPVASNKDKTKKQSTPKDQCPTSEVLGGKMGGKGKDQKKHTSDIAKKTVPGTSNKEQSVRQSALDRSPNSTKPSSDKSKNNVPATPRKEQTKKQPTHKDQVLSSEAESAKTVCNGKEPKKHNCCGNAKNNVATTSSKDQPKKYSTLQDQSPTSKSNAGKKGGEVKGPKTSSCDDAKKNVPTTSSKEEPKRQPAHKKGWGKEQKKSTCDSAERTDPTTSSKASTKKTHPVKTEEHPSCKAHTAKKGGSREETEEPICENPEKSGPTTSLNQPLRKEQDHCEASAVKNTGKGKKPKKQSSNNLKSLPEATASSKEQVEQELTQKDQVDAGKKMTTSASPDQWFAKTGETPCVPEDSKEEADQSADSVKDSESEWILVGKHNTTKHKDKKKMGPGEKCQAGAQKTPSSELEVDKETQSKSSTEPGHPIPGDKDQKAEEPPKKKRPTRRAKKKPKKGKPKPSVTCAAKEDSPVSPQEQNTTNVAAAPMTVVNTWASIVRSKPQVDTPPSHNQSKAPGSQGEETQDYETQKETKLEESVTEIPWNVPVTYKKCIGRKNKAHCVEQKTIITTGKIVEPLKKSSACITTSDMQEVGGSLHHSSGEPSNIFPITQEDKIEDSVTVATLDNDEVCGPLQPPARQPKISSPNTQEVEVKDAADVATPFKQESTGSLPPVTNQPKTDPPITQEAEMKDSGRQGTEKAIPAKCEQQEEVLHVLGLSIPNFAVILEDEREEEAEDSSSECHDTKLFMTHEKNCIIAPSKTNALEECKPKDRVTSVTVLTTNATQTGEPATPSTLIPSVSEPFEQRRFKEHATGTKVLTSTATQTDEHALQVVKSLTTCAPVRRQPTDDKLIVKAEVPKSVPEKSTQNAPKMELSQMSASSPAFVPRNASPAVTPKTTVLKNIEDQSMQVVKSSMAASSGPSDHMLTVQSEVQRSFPVRYVWGVPAIYPSQMPAFEPVHSPYSTSALIQPHGNTPTVVNSPTNLVAYIENPSTLQYGTTYYQNYSYLLPAAETWHMGYESTLYNAYSNCGPVHQRPILSPMVESYRKTTFPVKSLRVPPTIAKVALPSPSSITKTVPLQLKKQQSNTTSAVKQVVQKPRQAKFSTVVPATSAPLEIASPSATKTPKAATPHKHQQTYTTPALQEVVQKPEQLTFSKIVPTTNAPLEKSSPTATHTSKTAALLKQQQTFTTPAIQQAVQNPDQVTSSTVIHTSIAPPEMASPSATETTKAAAPLKQQQNTFPAVKQVAQKPDQVTSSTIMPTINVAQGIASSSATETPKAAAPLKKQQKNTTPAVKQVVQKPDPSTVVPTINAPQGSTSSSATKTPKAAATLKQQQMKTTPAVKQVVQKPDEVISSTIMPTINAPQCIALPSATKISKAAAPLKQQQKNTPPPVQQVVQKPDEVISSTVAPTSTAPLEIVSPSATETPKAAAPLKQHQKNPTPAVKQFAQKPDQAISSTVVPTSTAPLEIISISATETPKAAARLKQQQKNTTPAVKQVVQKPDPSTVVPTINAPQRSTSPSATETPKAAAPLKQQQKNTSPAVKQVVQKPDQVTSSTVEPTSTAPLEIVSPSVTETPKAAAPLKQQQKNTTPAVNQVVQKPDQVISSTVVPTINSPQGSTSPSATETPKAAEPLKQQQKDTTPAVKQVVQKPDQVISSTVVPTINLSQGSTSPSVTETPKAAAPLKQQQMKTTPAVKQVVKKPDPSTVVPTISARQGSTSLSATKTPKAAAPLKKQQKNTHPPVKQVLQKPDEVISSTVAPTSTARLEIVSPSVTETPKAAAPLKQQQKNTTPAVKQVVQKPDQVTSSTIMPTINAPQGIASPSATETPKAAASLKQQQKNTTPAVKQVVEKPDQVTSSTIMTTINAPQEIVSPSASETPKAAAPLKQQQKNTTPAVKQVVQKPNQVTSSTIMPTISSPQGIASPSATETPKAAAPLKQQQKKTTPAVKQVVHKSDKVTSSTIMPTISSPQGIALPSDTLTPKTAAPLKQQQKNTTPAVKQVVQKPDQVTSSTIMTTINTLQGIVSPSATETPVAAAPLKQQQKNTTLAVKQVVQKLDQVISSTAVPKSTAPLEKVSPSATDIPKAAAPLKHQQENTIPAVKQVVQKPDQVISSTDVPTINEPQGSTSPSATKTSKAAAPLKQQQKNTTPAVKQVVQKMDKVTSSTIMPTFSAPQEIASPSATETPKAAAPLKQQQMKTTPAIKQVVQKPDQVISSTVVPAINAPQGSTSPSATETPKVAAPLKQQQKNTTPAVKQVVQKPDQVTSSTVVPTINAPQGSTSPSATETPKAAAPLKQQQKKTTPAVKQVVQKPDQVTPSTIMLTINAPQGSTSISATETPKTAAPLKQQQKNTTPSVKQVVKKPDQVISSTVVPTINAPQGSTSPSATETPKAAAPLKQQQKKTTPAVKQVGHKSDKVTSSTIMPTISSPQGIALPSDTETPKTAAPLKQQQKNTTPAVKQVVQKLDQVTSSSSVPTINAPQCIASPSATETPKAAAPLKQQQKNTMPAVKQVVQKPDQVTSSIVLTTISTPQGIGSPSATETPKVAVPLKQQQSNTIVVEQFVQKQDKVTSLRVEHTNNTPTATETLKATALHQQQQSSITPVKQILQKPDNMSNDKVAPTTSTAIERALPTDTEIPEVARLLKQQLTNTSPIKQVFQESDPVASSKAKPSCNIPLEKSAPTATKIPEAVGLLKQANTTCAVKQVIKKSGHVPSSKNGPTTNEQLKKAAPAATKKSKIAAMCRNQQVTTTTHKQVMQKPTPQVASPNEMTTANTPQERASPVSMHATKTIATVMQQAYNTSSQSVRPKERGPVATSSLSKIAETSAVNQTDITATGPKNSRSARRRRARARQREKKRAAEAERSAEKERRTAPETSEGAAALVEDTEGADSSNHHVEVASSSSSEIILNFDDDSEFVIDWEAEAAKPFYNSTEIFPPRVEIPEWAQWDFSQNERLQQLGQENHHK